MIPRNSLLLCLVLCVLASVRVDAQYSLVLYLENDAYWSDSFYTHGTKLEVSRLGSGVGLAGVVFPSANRCVTNSANAPTLELGCYEETTRFAIGQNLYTPAEITEEDRMIGDRPYGGWLYIEARTEARTRSAGSGIGWSQGRQWTVGGNLGVVGPWSMADTIQRWWHESVVTSAPRPEGWEHQISNRPAVMAFGNVKQRFVDIGAGPALGRQRTQTRIADLSAELGGSIGNVLTAAHVGGMLRAGYNVGDDFGPTQIGPAPAVPPPGAEEIPSDRAGSPPIQPRPNWALYGFTAVEGRGVLYNVFLDAEAERHRIERTPLVADFSVGAALRICRFILNYRMVLRSPEFQSHEGMHRFHAISLGMGPRCR